uniref:Ig-like domain-containing protein n=1 Tax=Strongyloides stercoralis TaxID=6248 RepID=A0A0K0DWF5_STRER
MKFIVLFLLIACFFIYSIRSYEETNYNSLNPLNMNEFLVDSFKNTHKSFENPIKIASGFSSHFVKNNKLNKVLTLNYCNEENLLIYLLFIPETTNKRKIIIREEVSGQVVNEKNYKVINSINRMYILLKLDNFKYNEMDNKFTIQMVYDTRLKAHFIARRFQVNNNTKHCRTDNPFGSKNELFISSPFNVKYDDTSFFIICAIKKPKDTFKMYFQYFNKKVGKMIKVQNDNTFFYNSKNDFLTMIFISENIISRNVETFTCTVENKITGEIVGQVVTKYKPKFKENQWIDIEKLNSEDDNDENKSFYFKDCFTFVVICIISLNLFGQKIMNIIKKIFRLTILKSQLYK